MVQTLQYRLYQGSRHNKFRNYNISSMYSLISTPESLISTAEGRWKGIYREERRHHLGAWRSNRQVTGRAGIHYAKYHLALSPPSSAIHQHNKSFHRFYKHWILDPPCERWILGNSDASSSICITHFGVGIVETRGNVR